MIFAFVASLVAAFRDITVQTMLARSFAGNLSRKLDTDVKIQTFYITYDLSIVLEGLQIDDLNGLPLFEIGTLKAKLHPFFSLSDIRIRNISLENVLGRIVKYEGEQKLNVKEVLEMLNNGKNKKQDDAKSPFRIRVDDLALDNIHVVYWNQNKDKPEKLGMDYLHIDVDSICGRILNLDFRNDSIFGNITSLSGKERSGLPLNQFRGDVMCCPTALDIDNLIIMTNASYADLDLDFLYNDYDDYNQFVDSVRIIGNIRPSSLVLSDLKYFSWVLNKMPDTLDFTAYFDGTVSDFVVTNLDLSYRDTTHIDADVSMKGLPDFFTTILDCNFREITTSYDDLTHFAIPSQSVTIPLPEMLSVINSCVINGSFFGYPTDFISELNISTNVGDIETNVTMNIEDKKDYTIALSAGKVDLSSLLNMEDETDASFSLFVKGKGFNLNDADLFANVSVKELNIFGNRFADFDIDGVFKDKALAVSSNIKHHLVDLNFKADVNLSRRIPRYHLKAKIQDADIAGLNLLDSDSTMLLSSNVDLAFSGNNIDNITGSLNIENTSYYDGKDYFLMKDFEAEVSEASGVKDVIVKCDFFDINWSGIFYLATFQDAMRSTVERYINLPFLKKMNIPRNTHKQEFSLSVVMHDTRTLTKLLMPQLNIGEGTMINATYTNGNNLHGSTIESPMISFNNLYFKNINIRNTAKSDTFTSVIFVEDIISADTSSQEQVLFNLENIIVGTKIGQDTARIDLAWDDDDISDHNKAHLYTTFVPYHDFGGLANILTSKIIINDSVWSINPQSVIDFREDKVSFRNLDIFTPTQMFSVNGSYPKRNIDTLSVIMNNVDVSDFDMLTERSGINLDGIIDGSFNIWGLNDNLSFIAGIEMKEVYLNSQEVGDVYANARWHEPDKSIFINSEIYNSRYDNNDRESVGLTGYYTPGNKDNNLRFDLYFDQFKLNTITPLVSSVISRVDGFASGDVRIEGSLKAPVITGGVKLDDAGCLVNFLNTYYTFTDSITLLDDKIMINDISISDTLGNHALVNGEIRHKNLRDFNFDVNIDCDNFLGINIQPAAVKGFYGSAIADGSVRITGPLDDIFIDIDALTKKGTVIDVPLSGASTLNNNFIVFVNKSRRSDTSSEITVPEPEKESNFSMNLDAAVNTDASVNIFLPQNMGNISANGTGNINLALDNNTFSLRGDYLINKGTFNFSIEMVKRTFDIRSGGRISWTGDPADADINIVGVYKTKSSISSLGIQVDSTGVSNNINVDCIIRLSDKLMNPSISFAIEMPNASDDIKNTVYTVIDTTNQSVMAQQFLSLILLNSFSYSTGNALARFGTSTYYNVITGQLSNWLSQISKDFDIGVNYTPSDNITNEELEVALSTQLFDDRLTIEGNFGVIRGNETQTNRANNIVGDVDITWRLTKFLNLKAYNHTNINSNYYGYTYDNPSDYTQGLGLSLTHSFDTMKELFFINSQKKKKNNTKDNDPVSK